MMFDKRYEDQVRLLVRTIPFVDQERLFALKGGTAINLFVQDMPRLSVDIDLACLSIAPRAEALVECSNALSRIAANLEKHMPGVNVLQRTNKEDELRIIVRQGKCQIKIEVSPVARGTLHPPERRDVVDVVSNEYGFASMQVISLPDLYGGKLCAAMDRQHPRDLFDVRQLLNDGALDRSIFLGFLVYLMGHPRPLSEVLDPRWKSLGQVFANEFEGMSRVAVSLSELYETRDAMRQILHRHFTEQDARFLITFAQGKPDWALLPLDAVDRLPAVRWKLQNIGVMGVAKKEFEIDRLQRILNISSS
ncbi:MAG TPA: nucleotidyl transferase AbiEii/AbiGii toxin family protein [Pseudomonadales bacterium]|nr:nucleotidyl transferase AbiEii/AbiGii toxin family protein [Pseudomonadales bacterium]